MRLTLRTMLAYLDDVLDSADAHELETKIEESNFASGLVHRVRDSMRRMRLGAPKLEGRGLGGDPNSVADYLDSTLPSEQVPEFEKVCLESDVHLAEVASCHQILTLVLGEPAEVDVATRERIYRIGQESEHPLESAAGITSKDESGNGVATMENRKPRKTQTKESAGTVEVTPFSRRKSQLSTKSLGITLALGFLVALVVFQAIGVQRLRALVGLSTTGDVVKGPASTTPDSNEPVISIPSNEATDPAGENQPNNIPADSSVSRPSEVPRPSLPFESEVSPAAPPQSADSSVQPVDAAGAIAFPLAAPVESEVMKPAEKTVGSETSELTESAEVAAVDAPRSAPAGLFISEEHVLARFEGSAGDWFRVAPNSSLVTGQKFVSLPAYRPQLLLSSNIKVTLAGESHFQLEQAVDSPSPILVFESGRAVLVSLGDADVVLQIRAGGRVGVVRFLKENSSFALDVTKYLPPGQQPDLEPAIPVIQLSALNGEIAWEEKGREEFRVNKRQVLVMDGAASPQLYVEEEAPAWIVGKDLSEIDRLASIELRHNLVVDRPLSLSLLERTDFRQVEVRSLACRSLCSLDMFDASIKSLDGARLRSYWYAQFDALRAAMARHPDSAIKLQRSFEKIVGDDAGLMYQMLSGFNADQLAAGGAKELIDALEHERVGTRVLAYENLRRITGKTQLFRPEQSPSLQKGEVMKWRRNFDSGAITYLHPPTFLPKRVLVSDAPTAVIDKAE